MANCYLNHVEYFMFLCVNGHLRRNSEGSYCWIHLDNESSPKAWEHVKDKQKELTEESQHTTTY